MIILMQLLSTFKQNPKEIERIHQIFENGTMNFDIMIDQLKTDYFVFPFKQRELNSLKRIIDNGSWRSAFKVHNMEV